MQRQSLRTSFLDDIGSRNAPVGSASWAKWFIQQAKSTRQDLDKDVRALQGLISKLEKYEAWKVLGYVSFAILCEAELKLSEADIEAIKHAKKGTTLRDAVATRAENPLPLAIQKAGKGKAGPGRGHKTGDNVTRLERGNHADYLTARIARDFPDILERMKAGEFKSVRQAAIEAGIVKVKTPLEHLKHWWNKANKDERIEFVRFCSHFK
jgi:hypothetical protein